MRGAEVGLGVGPALRLQRLEARIARAAERGVGDLGRGHRIARMIDAEPLRERRCHLVVRPALARRLDDLRAGDDIAVPAALVDVVMLQEHGGRQHEVGHLQRSWS